MWPPAPRDQVFASLAQCNGRRAKLLACDGNEIDTMFVDRRGTAEPQGQKLVRRGREPKGVVGSSRDSGGPVLQVSCGTHS